MIELYPFRFKTIFKEKIWGGEKIKTVLGKNYGSYRNCGEAWEISGVAGDTSEITNGTLRGKLLTDLISVYRDQIVGNAVFEKFGCKFPLLVKFIDANDDLSIQVHPGDELALKTHNSLGKTEMWYVVQADEGASLISGFNRDMDANTYTSHLNSGSLPEILNQETAKKGDVFFLPAGRIHTIGKGLLIAEIQQTSDITYRIYDYDRVDDDGNKRELHTEDALTAINFNYYPNYKTKYSVKRNDVIKVVSCPYFTTNIIDGSKKLSRNYGRLDSFVILICVEGELYVLWKRHQPIYLKIGECLLIPNVIKEITIRPIQKFKLLESYIEN